MQAWCPCWWKVLQQGFYKTQREAVRAISNYTRGGTVQQLAYLVRCGVVGPLLDILSTMDSMTILAILDVIQNLLMGHREPGAYTSGTPWGDWVPTHCGENLHTHIHSPTKLLYQIVFICLFICLFTIVEAAAYYFMTI